MQEALVYPEKIYHYTSLQTLIALIDSMSKRTNPNIRFSNALYLNDRSEINNSKNLFQDECRKEISKDITLDSPYDYYVASFSRKNDNLNQWVTYANKGYGVCIEFELDGSTISSDFQGKLCGLNVIYDRQKQRAIVKEIVKELTNTKEVKSTFFDNQALLTGLGIIGLLPLPLYLIATGLNYLVQPDTDNVEREDDEVLTDFLQKNGIKDDSALTIIKETIPVLYPLLKDVGFNSEDEFRLIYYVRRNSTDHNHIIKHRISSNNIIIPYVELHEIQELHQVELPLKISGIKLGPNINDKLCIDSIIDFLKCRGIDHEILSESSTQYRC